ncbi:hypothetical protein HDU81_000329, partial [Chytriomyces hyalinus]
EEKNVALTPIAPNGNESAGSENIQGDPEKNEQVEEKRQLRRSNIETSKAQVVEFVTAQFPVRACLDKEGNILVAGTYNGLLQMNAGNATSETDVFDAFLLKISSKTGYIIANHANFVEFNTPKKSPGTQSIFVVTSIDLDPCPESPGSIIVTGQSYLTSLYSKEGINHAFATMHGIRLVSLPLKDEKVPTNMFELRETSSVALGRLQVSPDSAATPTKNMNQRRITRGMHFVALSEPEGDSCSYFVSGVMVKNGGTESSEKGLISAAKVGEAYTAFVAQMSHNFTFKEDGVRFELPVFVEGGELKAPSIAVGLYSILYVSGTVTDPKIPYEALRGISLSETAPHNYILGIDTRGRRISSKTAIPQPTDLELLNATRMRMTLGDTVQLQSSPSSSDELVAHGMLSSQGVLDRGMWLGVLDLRGVAAYSESMAPKIDQAGEKAATPTKGRVDSAVATSPGVVAPSPAPIPSEPKSNGDEMVTTSSEQKEVVDDSKPVLTADSMKSGVSQPAEKSPTNKNKPPVVIDKPVQPTEKPAVPPPVNNNKEAEEDDKAPAQAHAEDAAGHSNEDRLRRPVETDDSFFTGVGFLFMFIFMAITATVLVIVYKLRRENLGDVIDMKDLPGSLYHLFNTLFDSKAQGANLGTYAPAASKQDDESELHELAHPAVTPGRNVLSAAPLTHRKLSVAETYSNPMETSVPINLSGTAPRGEREVLPFPGSSQSEDLEPSTDESWGWDDGDVFDDVSESKNVKKEDDEWGW